jgi:hypothetical protein
MTTFLKINWYFFHTAIVRKVNGLIYFARKLPVLGKHISPSLYREKDLKTVLSIIICVLSFIRRLLTSCLNLGIFSLLFTLLDNWIRNGKFVISFSATNQAQGGILFLLLVTVVWPAIYDLFDHLTTPDILTFVTHFQISYVQTIRNLSFFKVLSKILLYFLPLCLLALLTKTPALNLFLTYTIIRLFCFTAKEFLSRKIVMLDLKKRLKNTLILSLGLVVTGIFIMLYYFDYLTLPFTLVFNALLLPAIAYFSQQIFTFKQEQTYITQLIYASQADLNDRAELKKIKQNTDLVAGTAMQKELIYNGTKDFGKGSSMLNGLLFYRYQTTFKKGIRARVIFFAFILGAILTALVFSMIRGKLLFTIAEQDLLPVFPSLLFLMYFIGYGKKIVQICFLNCDKAMLYYPFYRESQTILSGFNERFKKVFMLNGILVLCIFTDIFIPCLIFGKNISPKFYLILILFLIALNFLFSFHELFVYYLLQPFTSDMTVVNPVYKIISGVFYVICWQSSRLHTKSFIFLVAVTAVSLIYVSIGYVVIKRYAPKTFRFKT